MHHVTERLRECPLDQAHVRLLARSLAEDATDLDPVIERLIDAGNERALTPLLVAMAVAGRRIDSRFLPGAAPLLIGLDHLAVAALHADGEVVDALVEVVRQNECGWEREALLLLLAAWICRRRAPERPLPEDLVPLGRRLAREARVGLVAVPLFALADVVEDAGLTTLLERLGPPPRKALITRLIRGLCETPARNPLAVRPEHTEQVLHEGGIVRRPARRAARRRSRRRSGPARGAVAAARGSAGGVPSPRRGGRARELDRSRRPEVRRARVRLARGLVSGARYAGGSWRCDHQLTHGRDDAAQHHRHRARSLQPVAGRSGRRRSRGCLRVAGRGQRVGTGNSSRPTAARWSCRPRRFRARAKSSTRREPGSSARSGGPRRCGPSRNG